MKQQCKAINTVLKLQLLLLNFENETLWYHLLVVILLFLISPVFI